MQRNENHSHYDVCRMRLSIALAAVLAVLAAAGCGSASAASGRLTVVATTTQVADLARQVGGERVNVDGMLRPGGDPHDYEPRPSDVEAVARAAVVFRSGGEVDDWLGEVIDNAGGDADVVSLIDSVKRLDDDPHWWQDPLNSVRAVEAIRAELTKADPQGRAAFARNAARTIRTLDRLDRAISACIERVPPAKRKIVTTHDALGYFARRYGVEVVGAVIPSLSTQAQASAGDVQALVEQIRREGVEAVFPESSVNPDIERAIAREAGARIGGSLYADSLGQKGSPGETYASALASDAAALVRGMSGGRVNCDAALAAAGRS
jgi:zinc/manganese transport system substrate-binding protein/manganese/iron transport system substrate-binding protein